jgi:hypothetical protein
VPNRTGSLSEMIHIFTIGIIMVFGEQDLKRGQVFATFLI